MVLKCCITTHLSKPDPRVTGRGVAPNLEIVAKMRQGKGGRLRAVTLLRPALRSGLVRCADWPLGANIRQSLARLCIGPWATDTKSRTQAVMWSSEGRLFVIRRGIANTGGHTRDGDGAGRWPAQPGRPGCLDPLLDSQTARNSRKFAGIFHRWRGGWLRQLGGHRWKHHRRC